MALQKSFCRVWQLKRLRRIQIIQGKTSEYNKYFRVLRVFENFKECLQNEIVKKGVRNKKIFD